MKLIGLLPCEPVGALVARVDVQNFITLNQILSDKWMAEIDIEDYLVQKPCNPLTEMRQNGGKSKKEHRPILPWSTLTHLRWHYCDADLCLISP